MRKVPLFVSLCLVVAMIAFAGISDNKKTAPHQIKGELEGTLTFVLLPTALDPNGDPVPFPDGEVVDTLGDVSGIVQSIGRTNMFTFHRPWGPNLEFVKDGLVRIVAANGDVIRGRYIGNTAPGTEPDQQIGTADFEITGGTGRFENATGVIHATVYITVLGVGVPEWPCTFVLEGTVNY